MRECDFGVPVITWFVAFGDFNPRGPWRPWHLLLPRGWRHVLLFGFVRGGWIVIDPMVGHADVRVAIGEEMDRTIAALQVAGGRFLRVERVIRHRWVPRGPVYCVTVAKHVLGVDGFAFTPRQLWDALIARGAVEVFKYEKPEATADRPGDGSSAAGSEAASGGRAEEGGGSRGRDRARAWRRGIRPTLALLRRRKRLLEHDRLNP